MPSWSASGSDARPDRKSPAWRRRSPTGGHGVVRSDQGVGSREHQRSSWQQYRTYRTSPGGSDRAFGAARRRWATMDEADEPEHREPVWTVGGFVGVAVAL